MSCCNGASGGVERFPGTGCCGSSCSEGKSCCLASEPRIRSCMCQDNVGCLDGVDCGGFRPRGTAATGACPGPCHCAEEEAWNRNVPPKPNCEWLSNFSELRRQWSDHGRKNSCKCCSCEPTRKAAPCRPCSLAVKPCNAPSQILLCNYDERLSGGACCGGGGGGSGGGTYDNDQRNYPGTSNASACEPCAPAQKSSLKPRSCCQCTDSYCLCQPMPRTCNCPPPVQVDARAERECSCECPSSPECACPPSERKFPKTRVRCPNAKLCCPTPRSQPGPKCNCTKCQPCLPPPCDPCTSKKCRPPTVRIQSCPTEPICNRDIQSSSSYVRPSSPSFKSGHNKSCTIPCLRRSGQFTSKTSVHCYYNDNNSTEDIHETRKRDKKNIIINESQCQCGDDARGCANECEFCCSLNCSINEQSKSQIITETQCNCNYNAHGCADNCNFCCSHDCANSGENSNDKRRISAGSDNKYNTYEYSNDEGSIVVEEKNFDEPIVFESNIQYPKNSQLKDLQIRKTLVNTSVKPKRSTRLLQSLMRDKSSKTQTHHQDSNCYGRVDKLRIE